MATPVVATPTAVAAIDVKDGREVLLGGDARALSRQITRLLEDPDLRQRLGECGRKYVESAHDWNRITERLELIYQGAIATPSHLGV